MRLWLLACRDGHGYGWDEAVGFVVAAPDEDTARKVAQAEGGDEVVCRATKGRLEPTVPFWTDPEKATCEEVRAENYAAPGVILRDFNAG